MNISIATFLPIGEIHLVGIATGAKEQGGDMIGKVKEDGTDGGGAAGFQEAIPGQSADIGTENHRSKTIASH